MANGRNLGDAPAWWSRHGEDWRCTSWAQVAADVRTAARALISLGLEPGDRVCILGFNRPAWVTGDVAAMAAGGVPAGIYETCSAEEVVWIARHAEAGVIFVEDHQQLAKLLDDGAELPDLRHLVLFPGAAPTDDPRVLSWEAFLARAADTPDAELDARLSALEDDQPATFIYTSGTTGPPKAVMLSHRNLAWTAATACELGQLEPQDSTVSYLPLCHIAEQIFTIHAPITGGGQVYFAHSRDSLPDDLKSVQPTVFLGVPRVWEKFHAAVTGKLAQATGGKKMLVDWAMGVARQVHAERNRGAEPGTWLALQHRVATKLLFDKLKPALGLGRARFCVTGAAPISKEILEFFTGLDITVHEVYGQSEGSGPSSFNQPGNTRFGTAGVAFPGTEIRLSGDGEIQVAGPHVFLGYFKDPDATAATLVDGWLQSGDLGSLDGDGFLRITGRKKEIIITAGGKNIAPLNIEAALKDLPLVSQAVVIGDRRKFLSALITLDPEATERHLGGPAPSDPMSNDDLVAEVQRGVDTVNARFARVEHVRRFTLLAQDFGVDTGELTPTMKIKRRVIAERYGPQIEAMYD